MLLSRSSAAVAIVSLALTSTAGIAAPCWDASELNPVRVHSLSTMLLVGALKCRNTSPEVMTSYQEFAEQRREILAGNAFMVSAHFINIHGTNSGKIAFANYESKIANQYSGPRVDPVSCARIGAYSRLAARASESDLAELAAAVAMLPAGECPAEPLLARPPMSSHAPLLASADSFDLEPPGSGYELAPVAAAPAEPVPVPAMAESAKAEPALAANVETAPAPAPAPAVIQAVATVEVEKPAPAPSAAEALAEAARALARAAVAMQKPVEVAAAK